MVAKHCTLELSGVKQVFVMVTDFEDHGFGESTAEMTFLQNV